MGRSGCSLLLLSREEDAYIEFLRLRNVLIAEAPSSLIPPFALGTSDVMQRLRSEQLKDRDAFDKAQRGYVSYVRAYKEHQCSFIFQLKQLDYGALANQLCLLKLPLMPELKALPPGAVKGFTAAAVDLETIKYSDKVREKARVVRLAAKKEERAKELEQKSNPKQQLSGGGDAKGKQAAASKVQPDSDSDGDDESDDGGSVSSNGSGSSSSQDSSKPAAVKRKRKGRKKGAEGAWSIKKAKAEAKRKRKASRAAVKFRQGGAPVADVGVMK